MWNFENCTATPLKKFTWTRDHNSHADIVFGMYETLQRLHSGTIPNPVYSAEELELFCLSLVKGQRKNVPGLDKPYCWCVAEDALDMPSDARVDNVFFPTYLAVAILIRFLGDYPERVQEIPGYMEAIKRGLQFSTYRGLSGHGYDATQEMINAVVILGMGGVPALLISDPDLCPELLKIFKNIKVILQRSLLDGDVKDVWGSDYTKGFEEALRYLNCIAD